MAFCAPRGRAVACSPPQADTRGKAPGPLPSNNGFTGGKRLPAVARGDARAGAAAEASPHGWPAPAPLRSWESVQLPRAENYRLCSAETGFVQG